MRDRVTRRGAGRWGTRAGRARRTPPPAQRRRGPRGRRQAAGGSATACSRPRDRRGRRRGSRCFGHSYGGAVITEAGNDPNVAALVYIAAFAPDAGESVNTLIADPPPGAPVPPILPPQDGFLFLDRGKFHDSFAADIPAEQAAFMADSQVPWGVDALGGTISEPAWRSKPQTKLVPRRHRRPDDPAAGPARDVCAGGFDRCRGRGQPFDLHLAARSSGRTHRTGRVGGRDGHALNRAERTSPQCSLFSLALARRRRRDRPCVGWEGMESRRSSTLLGARPRSSASSCRRTSRRSAARTRACRALARKVAPYVVCGHTCPCAEAGASSAFSEDCCGSSFADVCRG